mgnify:CR=1 FL=1
MNRRRFNQRNIALFGIVIGLVIASSARAQELQIGTGESPLFEGEQLLLNGSYAAAADIFQMADGLDRNEGIVGASRDTGYSSARLFFANDRWSSFGYLTLGLADHRNCENWHCPLMR